MCTGGCGGGPPARSRGTTGLRAVESLWGGKLGRAKESGGVAETRGRERSPGEGGGGRGTSVFAELWGDR